MTSIIDSVRQTLEEAGGVSEELPSAFTAVELRAAAQELTDAQSDIQALMGQFSRDPSLKLVKVNLMAAIKTIGTAKTILDQQRAKRERGQ